MFNKLTGFPKKNQKRKGWILDSFPVPEFLAMGSVGVAISESAIRIVRLREVAGKRRISKYDELPLDDGVIVAGELVNSDALTRAIYHLKKMHRLNFVNVSLPDEKAYVFTKTLSGVKEEDTRDIIELSLEESVPVARAEAIFDYNIVEKHPENDSADVSVLVYPSKIFIPYAEAVKKAGVKPLSFQSESQSIADAVFRGEEEDVLLIVNFSETKTSISAVYKKTVQSTTCVPVGSKNLMEVVKKRMNYSQEEAQKKLHEKGFLEPYDDETLTVLIAGIFESVAGSVARFLEFWQSHRGAENKDKKISKIVLSGSMSALPGFTDRIASFSGISTELADVWANCFELTDYVPDLPFEKSLDFASAAGCSLKN